MNNRGVMNRKFKQLSRLLLLMWEGVLCVCLWGTAGQAQAQMAVDGVVNDSLRQPLPNAFISLIDTSLTQIYAQEITDEQGRFSLSGNYPAHAILIIEALGYEEKRIELDWTRHSILHLGNIYMKPMEMALEEVVVEGQIYEIKQLGDSTIYKADDFLQGNEANIEEALKKLPGVEVKDDGSIYLRGKRVSKVMLEEDDLTGSNYALLTRNLSADLIDEFHFVDNYEENAALHGLRKTEELILNLKVKQQRFSKWLGTAELASGADIQDSENQWRRRASLSVIYLWSRLRENQEDSTHKKKINKFITINKHNNTGDDLLQRYAFSEAGGDAFDLGDMREGYLADFMLLSSELMQKPRNLFNNGVKSLNNLIFYPARRWKSQLTLLHYEDQIKQWYEQTAAYQLAGNRFERAYSQQEVLNEWMTGLRWQQTIDWNSRTNLRLNSVVQTQNNPLAYSNEAFINTELADRLQRQQYRRYQAQRHEATLTHRFHDRLAWMAQVFYFADSLNEYFTAEGSANRYGYLLDSKPDATARRLYQRVNSRREQAGVSVKAILKSDTRSYWEYHLGATKTQDYLQGVSVLYGDGSAGDTLAGYGALQQLLTKRWYAGIDHYYRLSKKLRWRSKWQADYVEASRTNAGKRSYHPYWLGKVDADLSYEYKSSRRNTTWSLTYAYERRLPSLRESNGMRFFPNFDLLREGADTLVPLQSQEVRLALVQQKGVGNFLQWVVAYRRLASNYAYSLQLTPLLDSQQGIVVNGGEQCWQSVSWELPLLFMYSKTRFSLDASRVKSYDRAEGAGEREIAAYNIMPAWYLESRFFGWFNYALGARMHFIRNEVRDSLASYLFENHYFSGYVSLRLRFMETRLKAFINYQWAALPAPRPAWYPFLDMELQMEEFPAKRYTAFLKMNNLTGQSILVVNSAGSTSTVRDVYFLLPRYFLLGVRLTW